MRVTADIVVLQVPSKYVDRANESPRDPPVLHDLTRRQWERGTSINMRVKLSCQTLCSAALHRSLENKAGRSAGGLQPATPAPASLFSLCCMVLMVFCISSSPLARVCGRRARCFSTLALRSATVRRRESTSSRISSSFFMRSCAGSHAVINVFAKPCQDLIEQALTA